MPLSNRIWISSLALAVAAAPLSAQIRTRPTTPTGPQTPSRPIEALRWLSGCWERRLVNVVQEEHWSDGRGGQMLGFGKIVRRDTVFDYEFVRIYEKRDTLVYEAHPRNQEPAEFRAYPPWGTTIVFSNPAHDYPQRIIYRRVTQDSMVARVEGGRRYTEFPYARKACS